MKKLALLLAVPLALAGCGSDSTTFTIATGAYKPSAGTATSAYANDNCNMVPEFSATSPNFNIEVNGANARFDLKGGQTLAQYFTSASISGNAITHVTDANYLTTVGATCVYRTKVQVRGEITADNQVHLIAKYDKAVELPATCTIVDVDAKVLPCTSEVDFLGVKQ